MKLLPDSLLERNVLLMLVLIVLSQVLGGLVFYFFVKTPFIEHLAETLADNLIATKEGIRALPIEQREAFVDAFNIYSAGRHSQETIAPLALPAERMLVDETSERLVQAGISPLGEREASGIFYVQITLDSQSYRLATASLQAVQNLPLAALTAWLIVMLLALLGALSMQRLINRPLTQLVKAAQTVGRNETIPILPENGPREIADVSRCFNRMRSRLTEQERQRAIMLAGVSHDLRTPLTKIRLIAEIIVEQTGWESAANIARHCNQIESIIGQFIDFAGIGSREKAVPTDLNLLIARRVRELGALYTLKLDDALPPLNLRPLAVQRMLDNLIENALRYARPPYCIFTSSEPGWAVIRLHDHGEGIPEARLEEMLQPFTRGEEAQTQPGSAGLGLGLAIAVRVAEMENGHLTLGATESGGLEVLIKLPKPLDLDSPKLS